MNGTGAAAAQSAEDVIESAHDRALRKAYDATVEYVEKSGKQDCKDYAWLASLQYALYCAFSEQGTTAEQDELLKAAGLPSLQ